MKPPKTYTLTKAEIQIMNILWEMPEGGCVHDIMEHYEEPKPAYTTIATFMKILLNKKFVGYRKQTGKPSNVNLVIGLLNKSYPILKPRLSS